MDHSYRNTWPEGPNTEFGSGIMEVKKLSDTFFISLNYLEYNTDLPHLNVLSLLSTFSSLKSEGRVSIDGAGELYSYLSIFMNLMGRLGFRNRIPGRGNKNVDIVEICPSLTGRVQRFATLG